MLVEENKEWPLIGEGSQGLILEEEELLLSIKGARVLRICDFIIEKNDYSILFRNKFFIK
jgi:hypothetical protein